MGQYQPAGSGAATARIPAATAVAGRMWTPATGVCRQSNTKDTSMYLNVSATAAFVRNEPPPEESDAHWLLDFYSSFMSCNSEDTTDKALECLSKVCAAEALKESEQQYQCLQMCSSSVVRARGTRTASCNSNARRASCTITSNNRAVHANAQKISKLNLGTYRGTWTASRNSNARRVACRGKLCLLLCSSWAVLVLCWSRVSKLSNAESLCL
eukprot:GHUV01028570.1.p1 GENE.GHUV01028570.1~~GHUV01028570.1.p1  ORF type:complete len:213 (+),score=48.43 GHUV01028570.1:85-723(+)